MLLHVCCAPCSTYTIDRLRSQGFQVTGFWYNPNIHPWQEHERRREALAAYAEEAHLPMIWHSTYEMPLFLRAVAGKERFRQRCAICYRLRLERTAETAEKGEFDAFTTTLLISPYQDQEIIKTTGERIAGQHGLQFYFENFRHGWAERGRMTREHDLYRQQYCGCIYSEWERYNKAVIDDLLPSIPAPENE
jgi:predicted adenine nucleotide alpha hydrolase (AANH) superfamily ATPase